MPLTWLFGGIGIVLLVAGWVLRRAWISELLPRVDVAGYSESQVREAQRASVEGDAPADRELLPLARAYAARAVHNIPVMLHWLPVLYVGAVLLALGVSDLIGAQVAQLFVGIAVTVGVFILILGFRSLLSGRRLLHEHPL